MYQQFLFISIQFDSLLEIKSLFFKMAGVLRNVSCLELNNFLRNIIRRFLHEEGHFYMCFSVHNTFKVVVSRISLDLLALRHLCKEGNNLLS
jgi:hypothetical protein